MGRAAAVLESRRAGTFAALAAAVVVWFVVAPHLARIGLWPDIAIVSIAVMPATLLLLLVALPLHRQLWVLPAAVACALLAFGCSEAGWGLPTNFAKLWAAVFAGWAFLMLFERLSWVVLVALLIPLVDALSVWRGPTHALTTPKNLHIYRDFAIAFLVPGGGAAYLGPPDVLFYALFLGAAARWGLRVGWTWVATTFMYGLTVVIANAAGVGGLPALPFLSFGFLAANADLLWARRASTARSADSTGS